MTIWIIAKEMELNSSICLMNYKVNLLLNETMYSWYIQDNINPFLNKLTKL